MIERMYAEYAWEKTETLLAIDSPSGYTAKAAAWVKEAFENLGFSARLTRKGGVLVDDMLLAKICNMNFLRLTQPGDVTIDVSGCPDLVPPLAVMAAVRSGTTRFVNAARLRIKESDRLATVHQMLTALGGQSEELPDGLTVQGVARLAGGTVDGANDHRIVMSLSVLCTHFGGEIEGAEAVKKSMPDFFENLEALGAHITKTETI